MLCTVGDLLTDVVVHLRGEPRRGTDNPARIHMVRGGSAANVALAAVEAGGTARFVGQVGDDDLGHAHVEALRAARVDAVVRHAGSTGTAVVLVDPSGERSSVTDRGTAIELSVVPDDVLDGVGWLHLPADSFVDGALADTAQALVADAAERSIPVSISTSSVAALAEFGRAEFLELIAVVGPTVVIANRAEARFVLRDGQRFPKTLWSVITNGARATTVVHAGGERRSIRPDDATVVDTIGAGDAFTGAFLVRMLGGDAVDDAVRAGHELAARTLRHVGAALGES
ncbi:MAG: carbohydrate kinase family protein [Acidimicrobiales bacterium]